MFYLHRNGETLGPFSDKDLREAFYRGELAGAVVCVVGADVWVSPEAAFAAQHPSAPPPPSQEYAPSAPSPAPQAFEVAPMHSQPPAGYEAPVAQSNPPAAYPPSYSQSAPPPGMQGGQAPYTQSAPPHAYDVRSQYPTHAPFAADASPMGGAYGAPPRSTGKVLAVIAACTAGLAIVGGAAAFGVSRFVHGSATHLAGVVPQDTTVFVEAPNLKHALVDLAAMKVLDSSAASGDHVADVTQGVADAFGIRATDAAKLVLSADAVAFAGRDLDKKPAAEVIVAFGSSGPVEALLSSSRFTRDGTFGKSGQAYKLAAGSPPVASAGAVANALASVTSSGHKLVYFEGRHLLVEGDEAILRDTAAVIESGAPALEKRDTYVHGMKQVDAASDVQAFVDEAAVRSGAASGDAQLKKLVSGYLRDPGSIETEVKLAPAGVLFNAHATLSGDSLPSADAVPAPVHLTFPRKLPAETIAYLATTTKNDLKGADAKDRLIKALQGTDANAAAMARAGIDSFETESGFTVAELLDMVGDETAIAVLADKDLAFAPKKPATDAALAGAGLLVAMQVDDETIAKKVVDAIQSKAQGLGGLAKLVPGADGFRLEPAATSGSALGVVNGQLPTLELKLTKKAIVLGVAQRALLDRALSAFETGKGTLDSDEAHELAMKALRSDAHGYLWMDLGRIVSLAYQANPKDRASATAMGVPVDAVKLTGAERLTAAIDYRLRQDEGGSWILDVESLNVPGFALLAGEGGPGLGAVAKAVTGGGSASGAKAAPAASTGPSVDATDDAEAIGVASCDAYLTRLSSCGQGQPDSVGASFQRAADNTRAQWLKLPTRSRQRLAKSCASLLSGLDKNTLCR